MNKLPSEEVNAWTRELKPQLHYVAHEDKGLSGPPDFLRYNVGEKDI